MQRTGQADPERLRRDVAVLAGSPRGRRHAPRAMAEAEEYVTRELAAAGWHVTREPFTVPLSLGASDAPGRRAMPLKVRLHRGLTGANLRAERPDIARLTEAGGTVPATLVIGAHLDTVRASPGADDNASGVAALLETARLLSDLPAPPAVTFLVLDMEELGLVGSRVAVRGLLGRRRGITGMICLESVGFFSSARGSQRLPPGIGLVARDAVREVRRSGHRGDFTLVVHRHSSASLARTWTREAEAARDGLPALLLRDPRPDGPLGALLGLAVPPLGNLDRSDHAPFWNRRVPAVMLTSTADFRNAHYHRAGDTADLLDYERLADVATATARTAELRPGRA